MLLLDGKDYEKALEEIELTLAVDHSMAEAVALRGLTSYKQGGKDKAKEDLSTALCMEPRLAGEKRYKNAVKKLKISPKCGP
jgi:Tfp pilus assembly protein PilF